MGRARGGCEQARRRRCSGASSDGRCEAGMKAFPVCVRRRRGSNDDGGKLVPAPREYASCSGEIAQTHNASLAVAGPYCWLNAGKTPSAPPPITLFAPESAPGGPGERETSLCTVVREQPKRRAASVTDSGSATLTMRNRSITLQQLLATWTGVCIVCGQPFPRRPRDDIV